MRSAAQLHTTEADSLSDRFTTAGRDLVEDDLIVLTSVGVDIGSATSHLLFSRLELERSGDRYVLVERVTFHESDVLLTPYRPDGLRLDDDALGRFIDEQYQLAEVSPDEVDTGVLILTGLALERENSYAVGELFANQAGKFVAISAGDNLEGTMSAYGSGAAELSRRAGPVLHVDIGGGTTKVSLSEDGRPVSMVAFDIGARMVVVDEDGTVVRLEPSAIRAANRLGVDVALGSRVAPADLGRIAALLVDELLGELDGRPGQLRLARQDVISVPAAVGAVTFAGGVSDYIFDRTAARYGDLGVFLADAVKNRFDQLPGPVVETDSGIRATVLGASQYTVQVSGNTIHVEPTDLLPLRNVCVVAPSFSWPDEMSVDRVSDEVRAALRRFDFTEGTVPVALGVSWRGPASYARLDTFSRGVLAALAPQLAGGHPIVFVFDSDVGGLAGLRLQEIAPQAGIVSIDGIDLREFDYIDVGSILPASGVVPVVVKTLVFPIAAAPLSGPNERGEPRYD